MGVTRRELIRSGYDSASTASVAALAAQVLLLQGQMASVPSFNDSIGVVTLADNTVAFTDTGFEWSTTTKSGVSGHYRIRRGTTFEEGRFEAGFNASEGGIVVLSWESTSAPTGVDLQIACGAGKAKLQYKTTATGNTASLDLMNYIVTSA